MVKTTARVDDEIRPAAFFHIGRLPAQYHGELLFRHAGTGQDTLALDLGVTCHDDDLVDAGLGAAFEEQGNVEHDDVGTRLLGLRYRFDFTLSYQRMDDHLEQLEITRELREMRRQQLTVNLAIDDHAWKSALDRRHGLTAIKIVHDGIGIDDREAFVVKHPGGRRLAHANRTGEAEPDHPCVSMSAIIMARSSSVTAGRRPNHFSKPGTAWCSSMPRPSAMRMPCCRAWARIGVISGT